MALSISGNGTISGASSFTSNAAFSSTGALTLPSGNTAQRPAGANGMIRFNSTTGFTETYDYNSSSWQNILTPYNITYMVVAGGGGGAGQAGAGSTTRRGGGGGGSSFLISAICVSTTSMVDLLLYLSMIFEKTKPRKIIRSKVPVYNKAFLSLKLYDLLNSYAP